MLVFGKLEFQNRDHLTDIKTMSAGNIGGLNCTFVQYWNTSLKIKDNNHWHSCFRKITWNSKKTDQISLLCNFFRWMFHFHAKFTMATWFTWLSLTFIHNSPSTSWKTAVDSVQREGSHGYLTELIYSCFFKAPPPSNVPTDQSTWIPWNLSFRYILFHEKRLHTMLWHHNARVNSHQK